MKFYVLECGCKVLLDAAGQRYLMLQHCEDDPSLSDWDSALMGKVERGRDMTTEETATLLYELRTLVQDGYRFREIRKILQPQPCVHGN